MPNFIHPIDATDLLAQSSNEIDHIATALGLPRNAFDSYCRPLLRTYAEYVQKMPLMAQHFYDMGGAWSMGIHVALTASRVASQKIFFPNVGAEERRLLEPQCRYAAFVASLASGVAILNEHALVREGDDFYHPLTYGGSLHTWLQAHARAEVSWRSPREQLTQAEKAAIAAIFIPRGLLGAFDLRIPKMIYGAINPILAMNGIESTLENVVRLSIEAVLKHFANHDQRTYRGVDQPLDESTILVNQVLSSTASTIPSTPQNAQVAAGSPTQHSGTPTQSTPQPSSNVSLEFMLSKAHPALRDWFTAFKTSSLYEKNIAQVKITEEAIEFPIVLLGAFGLSGPQVRKHLEAAQMIFGKSLEGRALKMHLALRPLLFKEQEE